MLDATLVTNVTEGVKVCSLLDVALIKVTDDVGEDLSLDSPLVIITAGAVVEVIEVSSLLNTIVTILI